VDNQRSEGEGVGEQGRRLAETARQALHAGGAPGCAVAVSVDGHLVLDASFGSADLADTAPLAEDARSYIYSATKTLLATATLQLVQQGQLALDTAVQTYLPTLPLATPVTVRQLLSHTGGIPDYGGMPDYFDALRAAPTQPWTSDEFLTRTLARGLAFPPGQGWAYSNIGHLLIRRMIEQISGLSLRAALQRSLFTPLGLRRTFVAETLADASVLTPGYSAFFSTDGELVDIHTLYHPGWVSHGVVIATAGELARLFDALFAGVLLPEKLLAAMLAPTLVPHPHFWFRQPSYGLGLMMDGQSHYGVSAGHGGGGPGYSVGALHCTDAGGHGVTAVALVNQDASDLGMRIACALVDTLAST
jgi:D-alanyl-D-alanine carboxypeptidase